MVERFLMRQPARSPRPRRVTIVVGDTRGGVSDYTGHLVDRLRQYSDVEVSVRVVERPHRRPWPGASRGTPPDLKTSGGENPDVVLLQYVPHSFSRRGSGLAFALRLRWALRRMRRPALVVYAHELWSPLDESWRRLPIALCQRLAVLVLITRARHFVVSTEQRRSAMRWLPGRLRRRVGCIPISATITPPTDAGSPPAWRELLGLRDGDRLVCSFGLGHPTHDVALAESAVLHANDAGIPTILALSGGLSASREFTKSLGRLSSRDLWHLIKQSDVTLLPFTDGASSRRSTLISALGAGAVILSTDGPNTDPELRRSGAIALVPVGDQRALTARLAGLLEDPSAHQALRASARQLFEARFSWSTVASSWHDLLVDG